MIPAVALTLASIAQEPPAPWCGFAPPSPTYPCNPRQGRAWLDEDAFLGFDFTDSPAGSMYVYGGGVAIFHADDRETPIPLRDVPGREVIYCVGHAKSIVVVLDGMPPSDYRFLVAQANWATDNRPAREPTLAEVMVDRGLGSEVYTTREAASGWLARRGEAVLPALVAGLRSKDAEVRERCSLLLESIRRGGAQ